MNMPDRPIRGFKNSEFVEPEQVVGADIRIEELPNGIKFYLKGQAVDLDSKRITCRLYELISVEGGAKLRKDPIEKFINQIPDDEYIALTYGPNDREKGSEGYMWTAQWKSVGGDDKGIMSETIVISEKWRARYEAAQRKARAAVESPLAMAPAAPAPQAQGGGMDFVQMMALIREGEDRAIKNMERVSAMFKQNETPVAVMEKMWDSVGKVMERAMDTNLNAVRKVSEAASRAMEPEPEVDDDEGEDQASASAPASGIPAWLLPFLPKIEQGLSSLLGGGPIGAAVKTLIVSSDDWKMIFNDPEKFAQATEAMKLHFGEEKTKKALDMLLSRRPEKAAKGKGK